MLLSAAAPLSAVRSTTTKKGRGSRSDGHAHIAGGDPSAIDGNVLQKGHATTQAMFLLLGVAGNLGVIGEKKYAGFALEKVPDLGKKTLGARVVTNPMFIIPLNLWQTAHGAGVFGSA